MPDQRVVPAEGDRPAPDWGIVATVWVGLRGRHQTVAVADLAELRARLIHTAGGRPFC